MDAAIKRRSLTSVSVKEDTRLWSGLFRLLQLPNKVVGECDRTFITSIIEPGRRFMSTCIEREWGRGTILHQQRKLAYQ